MEEDIKDQNEFNHKSYTGPENRRDRKLRFSCGPDSRPKLNKTCVARVGQGMLLGDDDAMAAHFDPQVNFYSKSAKSISYGELYGIPTQEFISRA